MKLRRIDTALLLILALLALPSLRASEVHNPSTSRNLPAASDPSSVNAGHFIDDAALTARVKLALFSDNMTSAFAIKVNTHNGVVTLSGELDKPETLERAVNATAAIPGVKAVNAHLLVRIASFTVNTDALL